MAEILIALNPTNYTHPDPRKDKAGVYKKGDIVIIKPDGWPWGREEGLPKFLIVKLPGVTVDELAAYTASSATYRRINNINPVYVTAAVAASVSGSVTVTKKNLTDNILTKV